VVTDPHVANLPWFHDFLDHMREDRDKAQSAGSSKPWDVAVYSGVHGNPLESDVMEAVELYRSHGADSVVCVGGGSGLDAGKCVAMIAESGFETLHHPALDCLHDGPEVGARPPQKESPGSGGRNRLVPCVALATTSGTGAEMDSAAMFTDESKGEKRCAGHRDLPLAVILDAETTLGLPEKLTAWTGMDAAVHAIEALLVPDFYHPMCDGAALQALSKIDRNLKPSVACAREWTESNMKLDLTGNADETCERLAHHLMVRQEMLVASALAAVGFQRGLGAVHGVSEPIGAVLNTHHGLTNAVLLPYFLRDMEQQFSGKETPRPYGQNLASLRQEWESKCSDIARLLDLRSRYPSSSNAITQVIDWAAGLCIDMGIPEKLGDIVSANQEIDIESLAVKAERNQTGFGNAIRYTAEDYERVLRKAL
jgi:alcohol dehydrogenase class IV